jgi:hypothetical protein
MLINSCYTLQIQQKIKYIFNTVQSNIIKYVFDIQ